MYVDREEPIPTTRSKLLDQQLQPISTCPDTAVILGASNAGKYVAVRLPFDPGGTFTHFSFIAETKLILNKCILLC